MPYGEVRGGARSRRRVVAGWMFTGTTVSACTGLLLAAALVPAPAAVLPVVAIVCLGGPMLAVWELSRRIGPRAEGRPAAVRGGLDGEALAELRRALARLPETRHPLGL